MELDTFERNARYAQLDGGKRSTFVTETQDAISQTYSFPQKYADIDHDQEESEEPEIPDPNTCNTAGQM